MARLDYPDTLERLTLDAFQLQAFLGQPPLLAAVRADMNVRPEPGAVYRRVDALWVARILRDTVDLPATEMGAFDLPLAAIIRPKNKRAFARADPKRDRYCHEPILVRGPPS